MMKKQFYYVLAGVFALVFTACSKNNDDFKKPYSLVLQ